MARISLTIPDDLLETIDFVSRRFQLSRSALISEILRQSADPMKVLAELMPDDMEALDDSEREHTARRLRGASADIVATQVRNLLNGGQGDFFDGKD